jgi:hypothetical protein
MFKVRSREPFTLLFFLAGLTGSGRVPVSERPSEDDESMFSSWPIPPMFASGETTGAAGLRASGPLRWGATFASHLNG